MRPQFHFTPATGWINDPHGITYRDGGYDVFYQYVPDATVWQPNCHWGHARGEDLLSLQELPVAIAPGEGDDGIWTGSLVIDDDHRARVFYTATHLPDYAIGRIRTATPTDAGWIGWDKGAVVADAPEGLDLVTFRDPFVRREGDLWRMFVGAGSRDGTAMALTYVSEDKLDSWRYDGVALARSTQDTDPIWTGSLWECPQVLPIGDRYAMVTSVWDADNLHYAAYALGSYADGRFRADTWGRLTYGPSYYAPSLFLDSEQRPCLSFWMRGIADPDAGWASAHSIPHLLSLQGDRLVATPHPDIERYHREPGAGGTPAAALAIDITWTPVADDNLEIRRGSQPVATVSCRQADISIQVRDAAWTMPRGDVLRIIVDGPVLELATAGANFGIAIPTPAGELSVCASGSTPQIRTL
ncbi:MAG: glycoside hydrolase family 32 protein [Propionibacteriaceae bacterium]|nr:glycoside hydrolase family 32 protein [Propionibacteriaceae bacterium]